MSEKDRNTVPCVDGIADYVSWPTPGKEIEVNRTVLRNVADQLRGDLKKFTGGGAGTAYDIRANCGNLTTAQFGNYTGGQGISSSNKAAAEYINSALGQLVDSYEKTIEALETATKGYHDAEDRVKQASDRIKPESF